MKKTPRSYIGLLFLCGFFIVRHLHAVEVDILIGELPKQQEDTNKLWLLDEIIMVNTYNDPAKRLPFMQAMLNLAKKLDHHKGEGKAYRHYAIYYSEINDWDTAMEYIRKADSIYTKYDDGFGLAFVNNFKGDYYALQGQYEAAMEKYQESLAYYEKMGSIPGQYITLGSLATLFGTMERYDEAETYYLRSFDLRRKNGDIRGMAIVLNNLAGLKMGQQENDKALVYLYLCLKVEKDLNDLAIISDCKTNIATIYTGKGRLKEALGLLDECYRNYSVLGDTMMMGYCKMKEASAYRKMGQPEKGLAFLEKGMQLVSHFQLEDKTLGDFYYEYYLTYKAMGKYKEAMEYYEKMAEARDIIFSSQLAGNISELKEQYAARKKEQENQALKDAREIQDLKFQRQWSFIYGLGGILVLMLVLFILLVRTRRTISRQKTVLTEQKMLRSQMNPHFMFNALIAIQSFMYRSDPRTAGKFLSSFARLMRSILENSREEYISLSREISWTENYIDLQKLRFDNRFRYEMKLDEDIDLENTLIPPMLTQPFIENAIEHGFDPLVNDGLLQVIFKKEKDMLLVDIADNGAGIDTQKQSSKNPGHASLATRITSERLKLLNRRKNRKIYFRIDSSPGKGTRVSFSIPFRTKI